MACRTPHRDPLAGLLLKELRHERGLRREEVALAMLRAGVPRTHVPSTRTIWNVEELGMVPREHARFAFAKLYDRPVREIWETTTRATRERVAA